MAAIARVRPGEFVVAAHHRGDGRRGRGGAGDHPGDGALHHRAHLPQLPAVRHAPGHDAGRHAGAGRRSPSAPRPRPGWRSTASGRASTTRTAAASPRRSWTWSRPPTRRSGGSACPAHRSATSTTRAPTRSARSRRSSPAPGIAFAICDLNPKVRGQLDAYGLTEKIGVDRIFGTAADLVLAYRSWAQTAPPAPGAPAPDAARAPVRPPPTAEPAHDCAAIARRTAGGRGRRPHQRPARGARWLEARDRPARPDRPPRGAGRDPDPGPRADPVRADGRLPVHLLSGRGPADGGRPGHDAHQRDRDPALR